MTATRWKDLPMLREYLIVKYLVSGQYCEGASNWHAKECIYLCNLCQHYGKDFLFCTSIEFVIYVRYGIYELLDFTCA